MKLLSFVIPKLKFIYVLIEINLIRLYNTIPLRASLALSSPEASDKEMTGT